jgi:hypothetical protein
VDSAEIMGGRAMDKIQFNNLSVSDQACLLLDGGDLLATNCYYHYNVLLYNYDNQFMELVYDNRAKQVLLVRVVNDNIMQKYLDNIHLDLEL